MDQDIEGILWGSKRKSVYTALKNLARFFSVSGQPWNPCPPLEEDHAPVRCASDRSAGVGRDGIGPSTSSLSVKRSTGELPTQAELAAQNYPKSIPELKLIEKKLN